MAGLLLAPVTDLAVRVHRGTLLSAGDRVANGAAIFRAAEDVQNKFSAFMVTTGLEVIDHARAAGHPLYQDSFIEPQGGYTTVTSYSFSPIEAYMFASGETRGKLHDNLYHKPVICLTPPVFFHRAHGELGQGS